MATSKKVPFIDVKIDTSSEESTLKGLRDVVRSIWPEYTRYPDDLFQYKRFTDGITNILYRVTMDHHKVLVRIYGVGTEDMLDRDAEIRKQIVLSRKKLAADFYAKFHNGCCYEYLEGTPLSAENVGDHAELIASELARWHLTVVKDSSERPLEEPASIALVRKWMLLLPPSHHSLWRRSHYNPDVLWHELDNLCSRLMESPLRFCHNDVLPFNILVDDKGKSVKFIDYEYGAYNARGFDLGNHFNEYAGFDLDFTKYPGKPQQMRFINAYLTAFYRVESVSVEELERVYQEANQWSLVSHFLWSIWGLYQQMHSTIKFDFIGYSNKRFAIYFQNRDAFLSKDTKVYQYKMPNL